MGRGTQMGSDRVAEFQARRKSDEDRLEGVGNGIVNEFVFERVG